MSETRFTKGPWKEISEGAIGNDDGRIVAIVTGINKENVRANVAMVGSTLRLCEALEALVQSYDSDSTDHNFALPDAWHEAVAALKAARGEA